jgi:RIO kinase 1
MKTFWDELKVERKVFDQRTIFAIFKLMNKKVLKSVESLVKEGKESLVCFAKDWEGNPIALKIYRTLHCDFKRMWKYLISDPRFERIKKDRFAIVFTWAKREYKNLKKAYEKNVNCPKPFFVYENILGMEFIGKGDEPAPLLLNVELKNPKKTYEEVVENLKKLTQAKLVHSDLSPYNILYFEEKPVFIDFSQAVNNLHPLAKEFLERDCKNINDFFRKLNVEVDEELAKKLWEVLE